MGAVASGDSVRVRKRDETLVVRRAVERRLSDGSEREFDDAVYAGEVERGVKEESVDD